MPNNPNMPITTGPNTSVTGAENQGEVSRQTAQELGETGNEQVYIEKLLAKRKELIAKRDELATIEQQLDQDIEREEQSLANGNQSPSSTDAEQAPTTPEGEGAPQSEAERTFNRAKKSAALKAAIAAAAIAAIALVSGAIVTWFSGNASQAATPNRPGVTDVANTGATTGETQEAEGIYDGYGEKGMWLSQNKGGQYDFSSAKEVAEVCDDDECEMIKYTSHNQVESYADYLANLPEELQPEGFKGLTILETEKKLEGLSKEEFESIKQQYEKVIDSAFTRDVTLNGYYHNSYMRLIDPSKPATHDNMELVECVTYENGTGAVELFWTDDGTANGNIIGTMTVKAARDDNGNITGGCLQVVNRVESNTHLYNGMEKITENPPTKTPDKPTTPTTPTTPDKPNKPDTPKEDDSKNAEAIKRNMQTGDETSNRVEPRDSGELTERPDTSQDSYQAEQDYQSQTVAEARGQNSESANGGTVGDIIDQADQTYADHQNYTPEQQAESQQQAQAQAAQNAANQAAAQAQAQAGQNAGMSDAEAAEWFAELFNGGNG